MGLEINELHAGYGKIEALHGISLKVEDGDYVAVVGANGAGKSTLLKAISGTVQVFGGTISFDGNLLTKMPAHKIPECRIAHVPEGRQIFPGLSVFDNLMIGAWLVKDHDQRSQRLSLIYDLFPRLKERSSQLAGTLSGGEQQMVAVGRALMLGPKLIMLDEPSQGLAPKLVNEMYEQLKQVHKLGTSVLLVEQNTTSALKYSTRAYVMERGRIILSGLSEELRNKEEIRRAYLGI
ncbi:MAG: ABC transporter ATP-binding protein [Castellaniella sp.]|uniref:ABC transporter ATP-binding protein n=1 Tax=Castellaniella sp. TaxID=1955812 RepID=UPI00122AE65E|nr:ABC transporter ATP-binding protein [Castellaniella sp.]TAN30957.1 MAG: ABC transporter ATP-binding protein [Castellaniella sp.]